MKVTKFRGFNAVLVVALVLSMVVFVQPTAGPSRQTLSSARSMAVAAIRRGLTIVIS